MTEEQAEQADDVDEDVEDGTTDDEASGLQAGDFVKLGYTARTVEEEQLVDTTDPDVAEEEGVDDQQTEFKPRTIVLGEGHIFEAVEDEIVGAEAGDSGTVTIPAEEAFGEHDPDDVETISAEKIDEDDRYPGAHVQIEGRTGHITTIIGGRARVDFNHPLAGEDVEYDYEIVDVVDDREERAAGLFEMYLDVSPELEIEVDEVEEEVPVEPDDEDEDAEPEFETEVVEKETLYVESTPQLTMNQQWMFSKQQIAQDVIDKVGVDRVIVQEIIDGAGGMMGGMGGMMSGMGAGGGDIEDALEDADVDADEIVDELEADADE
ncbi:FKBP-type peptidyl-prolyl cis-trans isomerase [Natrialbaceae archaeon AArc-T1-2]|uniref:FKBP-type peptidyl-prolyl cis-trans isomerase n=1 Tax=Natrialbaceae archaeon AArc-T1-2 TaxID=3053904 RepID=UPI00255B37A9|nr:peptidylprolyl isomerase [Natrialbaceae archaeon AArc-T1-2]WIV66440.1 peptidylprolyl isomerase [Natrialbaceae archaeon AArc-T1-2]